VYNESVKAMRYPPDAYKKELKQAINANAKEERSIEELIKDMEDEFDE
jgi:26S proteasome regulatory subunit N3